MNSQYPTPSFPSSQSGAALIVSLIILAVVTILGITSMQSSNTELKLAASMRDRGVAFEAAEAALAVVEEQLAVDPPSRLNLLSTCAGSSCFNSTCENGLCFAGDFLMSYSEYECQVYKSTTSSSAKGGGKSGGGSESTTDVTVVNFWSNKTLDVWSDSDRHKTVKVNNLKTDVKYIVEFLCYVARDQDTPFTELTNENNNGAPLFRITALAEGNSARATVALQSTYKVLNGH